MLASIPNGTTLTLLGEQGDWFETEYQNRTGYVSKVFVEEQ